MIIRYQLGFSKIFLLIEAPQLFVATPNDYRLGPSD